MENSEQRFRLRRLVWTLVYTTLCVALAACGGSQGKDTDHYQNSITKQRACCGQLGDPSERARCIDDIVTVEEIAGDEDSESVSSSSVNQATFRCMNDHFTCDPETGRASSASQQAQLDCINDISQ